MSFSTRPGRMSSLGSILKTVQATCRLDDKAPWPIWSGSTAKPVEFQPMPKRQAVRLWHDARRFERQTREPGHQDGAIGRNGLAALYALLFDFLNHATGRLDPTRATLAKAANISIRSVDRGLAKLKAAGVLDWVRRFSPTSRTQIASAYLLQAPGAWRGFWQAPKIPLPHPDAWGAARPMPEPIVAAGALWAEGASREAQINALRADPRDPIAESLARMFAALSTRNASKT